VVVREDDRPTNNPPAIESDHELAHRSVRVRSNASARGPPVARAVYSIAEFCEAHGISQAMYFKMKSQGLGPVEMRIGSRRLISFESANAWVRAREATTDRPALSGSGGLPAS
jgi:hypothetical protein